MNGCSASLEASHANVPARISTQPATPALKAVSARLGVESLHKETTIARHIAAARPSPVVCLMRSAHAAVTPAANAFQTVELRARFESKARLTKYPAMTAHVLALWL